MSRLSPQFMGLGQLGLWYWGRCIWYSKEISCIVLRFWWRYLLFGKIFLGINSPLFFRAATDNWPTQSSHNELLAQHNHNHPISGIQWDNGPLPLLPLWQPQPVQRQANLQWQEERPAEVQRPTLLWDFRSTQLWGVWPTQVWAALHFCLQNLNWRYWRFVPVKKEPEEVGTLQRAC